MKKILLSVLVFTMLAWLPIQNGYTAWRNQVDIGVIDLEGETISGVKTLLRDSNGDILLATGTTVPTDTTTGYAKGSLFIDTDVVTGTKGLYENQGTNTSCVFDLIGAISSTDLVDGTIVNADISASAAIAPSKFAVLSSTQLYIGSSAGVATVRTVTGDVTVSNTGVTAIASGVVAEADLVDYSTDALHPNRIARATFDFAVDGGVHNTDYDMGVDLPDNAVVTRAWYEVITTFTSATDAAVFGIGLPTDDAQGIVAFASISSGTPFDAGYHEAIQTGTAANFSTKTTAARAVTFNLSSTADGDLTAGALVLFLEYTVSD